MKQTEVLVIGSGLAGVSAAIEASKNGAQVMLVSALSLFSGSSFFPGTWGFGLIAPKDESDYENLVEAIMEIGENKADYNMVELFVSKIPKAIKRLESYGISLLRPENDAEKTFIPCFDYKTREWYGIIQKDAKEAFTRQLQGVEVCEYTTILSLDCKEGRVVGAVGVCNGEKINIHAKAVIMASGGMGGLFKHSLNTKDVCGMGQYLALEQGLDLVNMEYFQMMLGFLKPCYGTIFNEKVYRYSEFYHPITGKELFYDLPNRKEIMEQRSMHGPFTSRLDSAEVDLRIYETYLQYGQGVKLRYVDTIKEEQPEFIRTYFQWLRKEKGITEDDEVLVAPFYHAANGGIKINQRCETKIKGLYACGEVTGGMHGADRIGGLSTANGLVFGSIAGEEAARYVEHHNWEEMQDTTLVVIKDAMKHLERIRDINYQTLMIMKDDKVIQKSLEELELIQESLEIKEAKEFSSDVVITYQLLASMKVSKYIMKQVLKHKDNCGSLYKGGR